MQSAEKTRNLLDIMRQNTKALSVNYKKKYESLRNTFFYSNIPLVVLTTCNAGYVVWKYFYDGYEILNIASDVITLSTAGVLIAESTCLNPFNKMEEFSNMYNKYSLLETELEETEKSNKELDLPTFEKMVKKYKEITENEYLIRKIQGTYEKGENALIEMKTNVEDLLEDHWNIIFRPTLRRYKMKNRFTMEKFNIMERDIEDGKVVKEESKDDENKNGIISGLLSTFNTKKDEENKNIELKEEVKIEQVYKEPNRSVSPTLNPSTNKNVFNMNFYKK